MKRIHKNLLLLLCVVFLIVSAAEDAYAYLDPGTGSYILQILAGLVLGALFTLKIFWLKIKNFFKKLFSKKKQ